TTAISAREFTIWIALFVLALPAWQWSLRVTNVGTGLPLWKWSTIWRIAFAQVNALVIGLTMMSRWTQNQARGAKARQDALKLEARAKVPRYPLGLGPEDRR